MTTPLISISLPTFWSGIELLEGDRLGQGAISPAESSQSNQAKLGPVLLRERAAILHQRRHPGGVIEASDVRADERRKHASRIVPGDVRPFLRAGAAVELRRAGDDLLGAADVPRELDVVLDDADARAVEVAKRRVLVRE